MSRLWARRASKDRNHRPITRALQRCGASVQELHAVGGGVPDLLVGYRGRTLLLEVKNPDTRYGQEKNDNSCGTLQRQEDWRAAWRGSPVVVVRSIDEALLAIGAVKGANGPP